MWTKLRTYVHTYIGVYITHVFICTYITTKYGYIKRATTTMMSFVPVPAQKCVWGDTPLDMTDAYTCTGGDTVGPVLHTDVFYVQYIQCI